jgi:hypothetical protein
MLVLRLRIRWNVHCYTAWSRNDESCGKDSFKANERQLARRRCFTIPAEREFVVRWFTTTNANGEGGHCGVARRRGTGRHGRVRRHR